MHTNLEVYCLGLSTQARRMAKQKPAWKNQPMPRFEVGDLVDVKNPGPSPECWGCGKVTKVRNYLSGPVYSVLLDNGKTENFEEEFLFDQDT
jgi:hypothetical protein